MATHELERGAGAVPTLPVVEVRELDWEAVRAALDANAIRARMQGAVTAMEALLDRADGPGMLFDAHREHAGDRAIKVSASEDTNPLWVIGDLHGDLLAFEASLSQIRHHALSAGTAPPRIVFLGDFFDDEGWGLEVLVRLYELIVEAPERVCVIAGNHDEALSFDGSQFASSVSPSDFSEYLNANLADEWIGRIGKVALRLIARAPRALFFPDGLLVAHGGFPLVDLHRSLEEKRDWNDAACLSDFVWARAHPKARRKMPNRFSRGSQFGYEDFADFCALSTRLGRPVTHMVRGHDHVEERYAIYPAYHASGADDGRTLAEVTPRRIRASRTHTDLGPRRRGVVASGLPTLPSRRPRPRSLPAEARGRRRGHPAPGRCDRMTVVRRCPNCGTTQSKAGECEACHEARVGYFCTEHEPGLWLTGPTCPGCAARLPRAVRMPPNDDAGAPAPVDDPEPMRSVERAPIEVRPPRSPLWETLLEGATLARPAVSQAAREWGAREVKLAGGALRRLAFVIVVLFVAVVIAVYVFGRSVL